MENKNLIPLNNSLALNQTGIVLDITKKLTLNQNRKLVKEIFNKNPSLFINLISNYYPLNIDFLEKYVDIWNWNLLHENEVLNWSEELIQKFENEWDWDKLSNNKTLISSKETIYKFQDNWNWSKLSADKNLPWSSLS